MYSSSSVTFRDRLGFGFCGFQKAAWRNCTCWYLRCKTSTCEGCQKKSFRIISANKQLEISSKSTFVLMPLSD